MTRHRLPFASGFIALGAAIVGLGASIASAIDDLGGTPTFCAETGCEIVRASAWARPLGIPMSILGIAFFGVAIALSFARRQKSSSADDDRRTRRFRIAFASIGGAWAAVLIGVQAFAIGAWCKLCLVADPAAIVYAICVLAGARPVALTWRRAAATVPALVATAAMLALWTASAPAPSLPTSIPDEIVAAKRAGQITVVEYVDFECPFCREMQKRLDAAIARVNRPVTVVRKMVPLPQHTNAFVAALAWCVADAHGKGDAMAHALFAADPAHLTASGCEALAAQLGIDGAAFRAGLAQAKQRVRADLAEAERIGVSALPTLFVGTRRFVGASASTEDLVRALTH